MRDLRGPFWARRLLGKLRSPAAVRSARVRDAIDDVDALFGAKGHLLIEGPGDEGYVLASYADDLAFQLRRLGAALRAASRRVRRYDRVHRRLGLPSRDALDDAAARLVAMADYLTTGQAHHNRHLRREVEQLLGTAPSNRAAGDRRSRDEPG